MKKIYCLLLAGALAFCACQKEGPSVPTPSRLPEEICQAFAGKYEGVFQLNEGQMGTNTATLDYLRFANGHYSRNAFQGTLGDVANDIAVKGDELWMVINNTGVVQVVSKTDCSEIAAISVPMPRNITFDNTYAYVTSWAGAKLVYGEGWSVDESASVNPKGKVYRINLKTKTLDEKTVEVGYQPEGIAYYDGKLFVANSGGIASKLPPDYQYGKTVSVIKTDTFDAYTEVEVGINPKNVIADSERIYVTTQGDFFTVHSALYFIGANANPLKADKKFECVTAISVCGQMVYGIGTEDELDWEKTSKDYYAWSYSPVPMIGYKKLSSPAVSGTALSGLCVLGVGDNELWMVTDQGDYVNPGRLNFYWKGEKAWSTTTGICPGHFLAL